MNKIDIVLQQALGYMHLFQLWFSQGICPVVGLLGHMIVLFLVFLTNTSKVERIGLQILPHTLYSPDLSPTNYHFFRHLDDFLQGKCLHNQQEFENAF